MCGGMQEVCGHGKGLLGPHLAASCIFGWQLAMGLVWFGVGNMVTVWAALLRTPGRSFMQAAGSV